MVSLALGKTPRVVGSLQEFRNETIMLQAQYPVWSSLGSSDVIFYVPQQFGEVISVWTDDERH